jgi:hypothetical protein
MTTNQNVKPKGTKDANKPELDHKIIFWLDGWTIHSKIQSMSEKVSAWVGQSPCAEVENPEGFFTHDLLLVNFQQLYRLIY